MSKTYKEWYLRGYEEGLREAWEEVARMAARGHTSKEIQLYIRSRKASIQQALTKKEVALSRENDAIDKTPYPTRKIAPEPKQETTLKTGYSYLVREDQPDKSYSLLNYLISEGHPAICITRTHPSQIQDRYGIGNTRMVWLTKKESGGMSLPSGIGVPSTENSERMSPSKLSELGSLLFKFLKDNSEKGGVVLFDGLEYLITQNEGFQPILKFIQYLNENVAEQRGILLLPSGEGLKPEWQSMLRKELAAEVR